MNINKSIKSLAHHAYLLIGSLWRNSASNNSYLTIQTEVISMLEEIHSISIQGNPDFHNRAYEVFTIDDARELKSLHEMRPVHSSAKKIFILTMNGITIEAQNALLKLLEEPALYAHFFFIVPSAHLLLPTVKSRMLVVDFDRASSKKASNLENAKRFLEAPLPKRLEIVKKLVDDISKEKKVKQDAIDLLNEIESIVYDEKGVKGNEGIFESLGIARKYLGDRAPSVKMLLEYVALTV